MTTECYNAICNTKSDIALNKIFKVIESCNTDQQIKDSITWGVKVMNNHFNKICHMFAFNSSENFYDAYDWFNTNINHIISYKKNKLYI